MSISPVTAATAGLAAGAPRAEPKIDAGIGRAAKDFEGVLIRQMLDAANIGGDGGASGYGGMIVDSLATGIVKAGGLGLAATIERAVAGAHRLTPAVASDKSLAPASSSDRADRSSG